MSTKQIQIANLLKEIEELEAELYDEADPKKQLKIFEIIKKKRINLQKIENK